MENHHLASGCNTLIFWIFISEKWIIILHSAKQWVFADKIADGKITVTLVTAKMVQIPVFHGTDLQI